MKCDIYFKSQPVNGLPQQVLQRMQLNVEEPHQTIPVRMVKINIGRSKVCCVPLEVFRYLSRQWACEAPSS